MRKDNYQALVRLLMTCNDSNRRRIIDALLVAVGR
jgi:hypothetical protein